MTGMLADDVTVGTERMAEAEVVLDGSGASALAPRLDYASPVPGLDEVIAVDATRFLATRFIRCDDPYLEGHYPGFPIYPGIFLIESVCAAVRHLAGETALLSVDSVRFQAPLRPGDELRLTGSVRVEGNALVVKADAKKSSGESVAKMTLRLRRPAHGKGGQR